jgi:iron complex outermembrane recepter protein
MASAKHNFSDDFMVYATTGSSWRAGAQAVGDFSLVRSPLENSFILTDPERSKSYEIGFKASALDKRLKINISAFHQDFKDYPYRSPSGVFFVETVAVDAMGNPTAQRVRPFNFIAGVPVKVNGVEAEVSFQATPDWDIGLNATYAKGLIKNGLIPCNDYFINATGVAGSDGIPDTGTQVPNIAQIQSASGNQNLNACNVTQRASLNPLWSANIQSEYRLPISDSVQGFARGLASFYGKSQNDPTNAVDDYGSYALVNLYAGIRSPKGDWEVSLYGKNITNTYVALTRSSTPLNTGYNIGAAAQQGPTRYYGISSTNPREFGINVRYAFGSR